VSDLTAHVHHPYVADAPALGMRYVYFVRLYGALRIGVPASRRIVFIWRVCITRLHSALLP
jgi:hypothetical protein